MKICRCAVRVKAWRYEDLEARCKRADVEV